jgi:hypothetical protein
MPAGRYLTWTALPGPKLRLRLRKSMEICCDDYHEPTEKRRDDWANKQDEREARGDPTAKPARTAKSFGR